MAKIIIGIHGLANKPEKSELTDWWKTSIREGLQKNIGLTEDFDYEMVYWADLMYKYHQHNDKAFDFDQLYNDEPYIPALPDALKKYKERWLDDIRGFAGDLVGSGLDFVKEKFKMDGLADWALGKLLKDLAFYYSDTQNINNRDGAMELANLVLKKELETTLRKHQDREIMLIAHSMGSIIAYDVLRDLGRSEDHTIKIRSFITIGSPLGLPHVKGKIIQQRDYDQDSKRVRTPSLVTGEWINYADKKDKVAIDFFLKDDYSENAEDIQVQDDLVLNDYVGLSGKENHHKSYGYLRTPEFSEKIAAFIA